jgi:hypothetical protein
MEPGYYGQLVRIERPEGAYSFSIFEGREQLFGLLVLKKQQWTVGTYRVEKNLASNQ